MVEHPRLISSQQWFNALVTAGIFREEDGNSTQRVVIDAQAGQLVRIYVERAADERLLGVALGLEGIEVSTAEDHHA